MMHLEFLALACVCLLSLALLRKQNCMDVGKNTTRGDGNVSKQFVQFFIIAHGKLHVAGDNASLLVVTSGITGQLQDFSCQVLQYCSQVHWCTCTNTGSVAALAQVAMNTADWELQSRAG